MEFSIEFELDEGVLHRDRVRSCVTMSWTVVSPNWTSRNNKQMIR